MPTISDKLYFNFDGKWSHDFGVMSVILDNNMFEDTFVATRELNQSKVSGSRTTNLQSIDDNVLEFNLNLAFMEGYDERDLDKVIRWLYGADYYRPLYFQRSEGRVFYCMPSGDSKIIHNGMNEGYVSITMKCNSSSMFSPIVTSPKYTVTNSLDVNLYNDGHFVTYPEVSIEKVGSGKITFLSEASGGEIFEILNLNDTEKIYIDCDREIIESDIIGVNRYDDVLGNYLKLKYGRNTFNISGNCKIQFRYKSEYRF